jgi:hypothetical protein
VARSLADGRLSNVDEADAVGFCVYLATNGRGVIVGNLREAGPAGE